MKRLSFLLSLLFIIFLSCDIPLAKPPSYEFQNGGLVLQLGSDFRTLLPNMDIATYNISGNGPGADSFLANDVAGSTILFTQNDLTPGSWNITVSAFNDALPPVEIARATETVVVVDNITVDVSITVVPINGTGDLSLTYVIPSDVTDPRIEARLTPVGGVSSDITFTITGDTATYTASGLADGYYIFEFLLFDVNDQVWGMMESVRILTNEETSFSRTLTNAEINAYLAGGVNINIDADMDLPLNITFDYAGGILTYGNDVTVGTTLDPLVTADGYRWFLNGAEVSGETASTIVVMSGAEVGDLDRGNYRLDVLVTYGTILSSNFVEFSVE